LTENSIDVVKDAIHTVRDQNWVTKLPNRENIGTGKKSRQNQPRKVKQQKKVTIKQKIETK